MILGKRGNTEGLENNEIIIQLSSSTHKTEEEEAYKTPPKKYLITVLTLLTHFFKLIYWNFFPKYHNVKKDLECQTFLRKLM